MTLPTWSNLEKSQIDSETIEEAIARLIAVHEADGDAHTGAGKSLNTHKTQSVVDHPAGSIVGDKIEKKAVIIEKLSWDKLLIVPSQESLDGWYTINEGTGGRIDVYVGVIEMKPGNAIGNKTYICIEAGNYLEVAQTLDPFFEIKANFYDHSIVDYKMKTPGVDPFDDDTNGFGFECLKADSIMYAFYTYGSTKYRTALTGITPNIWRNYRAECIYNSVSGKSTINYYVDTTLLHTYSEITFSISASTFFAIGTQQQTDESEEGDFSISTIVYSSKWP